MEPTQKQVVTVCSGIRVLEFLDCYVWDTAANTLHVRKQLGPGINSEGQGFNTRTGPIVAVFRNWDWFEISQRPVGQTQAEGD